MVYNMEFDYSSVIEVFETDDFEQMNRYLNGGWKQQGYSEKRDKYILVWIDSQNKPQHYPSSWDLLTKSLEALNVQDDQEDTQD